MSPRRTGVAMTPCVAWYCGVGVLYLDPSSNVVTDLVDLLDHRVGRRAAVKIGSSVSAPA
jgi:hypothetical protein